MLKGIKEDKIFTILEEVEYKKGSEINISVRLNQDMKNPDAPYFDENTYILARADKEWFKPLNKNQYTLRESGGVTLFKITDIALEPIAIQIVRDISTINSGVYLPTGNTSLDLLREKYNELQIDFEELHNHVRKNALISDANSQSTVLPGLNPDEVWLWTGTEWIGYPLANLSGYIEDTKKLLDNYKDNVIVPDAVIQLKEISNKWWADEKRPQVVAEIEHYVGYISYKQLDDYVTGVEFPKLDDRTNQLIKIINELKNGILMDKGEIPSGGMLHEIEDGLWFTNDIRNHITNTLPSSLVGNIYKGQVSVNTEAHSHNKVFIFRNALGNQVVAMSMGGSATYTNWGVYISIEDKNSFEEDNTDTANFPIGCFVSATHENGTWLPSAGKPADAIITRDVADKIKIHFMNTVPLPAGARDDKGAPYVNGEYYFAPSSSKTGLTKEKPVTGLFQPLVFITDMGAGLQAVVDIEEPYEVTPIAYDSKNPYSVALIKDIEHKGSSYIGKFADLAALEAAKPTPENGKYAAVGAADPYTIYYSFDGGWHQGGQSSGSLTIDIEDNLYQTSPGKALDARQGNILYNLVQDKAESSKTIVERPLSITDILSIQLPGVYHGGTETTRVHNAPEAKYITVIASKDTQGNFSYLLTGQQQHLWIGTRPQGSNIINWNMMVSSESLGDVHSVFGEDTVADSLMDIKKAILKLEGLAGSMEKVPDTKGRLPVSNDGVFVIIRTNDFISSPAFPGTDITDGQVHEIEFTEQPGSTFENASTWAWVMEGADSSHRLWADSSRNMAVSEGVLKTWIETGSVVEIQKENGEWYVRKVHIPRDADGTIRTLKNDGSVPMADNYVATREQDIATIKTIRNFRATVKYDLVNHAVPTKAECMTTFVLLPHHDWEKDEDYYIEETSGDGIVLVKYRGKPGATSVNTGNFFFEMLTKAR